MNIKQECIPVGCVPSTAVTASGGRGCVCLGGVCQEVSTRGMSAGGVCQGVYPSMHWGRHHHTLVKTLPFCNYIVDSKKWCYCAGTIHAFMSVCLFAHLRGGSHVIMHWTSSYSDMLWYPLTVSDFQILIKSCSFEIIQECIPLRCVLSRGCLSRGYLLAGICPGGCLPGCIPACTEAYNPHRQITWHIVKILPCRNFFVDGNKSKKCSDAYIHTHTHTYMSALHSWIGIRYVNQLRSVVSSILIGGNFIFFKKISMLILYKNVRHSWLHRYFIWVFIKLPTTQKLAFLPVVISVKCWHILQNRI